jgi:hypothetical protein
MLARALFVLLLSTPALAGSAGVRNGAVQGAVYDETGAAVEGVSVVAVRQISPPVIRNAITDERGNFFLNDLYVGPYILGFSKFGYQTIDTAGGGGGNTPTGPSVRIVIESGQASVVPRVTLRSLPDTSNGTVNITVLDLTTNAPVKDANVSLGPAGASPTGADGVYTVSVPAVFANGTYQPQAVTIMADGFQRFESAFAVFPKQTQNVTFRIGPLSAEINGRVVVRPGGGPADLTQVTVRALDVNPAITQGTVSSTGNFRVMLPASTESVARRFTLQFILPGFATATVPNVLAPRTGARTLEQDVLLKAENVSALGEVRLSDGQPPEGAAEDQVLIVELGKSFPIQSGQYTFPVPVGRPLTLRVTARNPRTRKIEAASTQINAASDGTPNPVFNVPLLQTRPQ